MLTTIARKISEANIDKTKTVSINLLKFDKSFKEVFTQEESKVERIALDMTEHGFDKSQPIIITEDYSILDGNSRFLAAQKAGIKTVPVIMKRFENKEDAIVYEYKLQLNRRNLTDAEIFSAFVKLQEIRLARGGKGRTDEALAEQLQKSPRQVTKMKEVSKKATEEIIAKIMNGEISLNRAYTVIKEEERKKIDIKTVQKTDSHTSSRVNEMKIHKESFRLGILYALNNIESLQSRNSVLKDSLVSKITGEKVDLKPSEKKAILSLR